MKLKGQVLPAQKQKKGPAPVCLERGRVKESSQVSIEPVLTIDTSPLCLLAWLGPTGEINHPQTGGFTAHYRIKPEQEEKRVRGSECPHILNLSGL